MIKYDITGRLRSLNPTCASGKCDMGCTQSGLSGTVLNYPRSIFNTGVSYTSAVFKSFPSSMPTPGAIMMHPYHALLT